MQQPNSADRNSNRAAACSGVPDADSLHLVSPEDRDLELSVKDVTAPNQSIPKHSNSRGRHGRLHNSMSAVRKASEPQTLRASCPSSPMGAPVSPISAAEERRKRLCSMKLQHKEASMRNLSAGSNHSPLGAASDHSRKGASLRGLVKAASTRFMMLGEGVGSSKVLGDSASTVDTETTTSGDSASTFESVAPNQDEAKKAEPKDKEICGNEGHLSSEQFKKGLAASLLDQEDDCDDEEEEDLLPARRSLSRSRTVTTKRTKDPPLRRTSSDKPRRSNRETPSSPKRPSRRKDSSNTDDLGADLSGANIDDQRLSRQSLARARSNSRRQNPSRMHTPSPKRNSGNSAGGGSVARKSPSCRSSSQKRSPRQASKSRHRTKPSAEDQRDHHRQASPRKPQSRDGAKRSAMRRSHSEKRSSNARTPSPPKRSGRKQRPADPLEKEMGDGSRHGKPGYPCPSLETEQPVDVGLARLELRRTMSDRTHRKSSRNLFSPFSMFAGEGKPSFFELDEDGMGASEGKEETECQPPRRSLLDIQSGGVVQTKETTSKGCILLRN